MWPYRPFVGLSQEVWDLLFAALPLLAVMHLESVSLEAAVPPILKKLAGACLGANRHVAVHVNKATVSEQQAEGFSSNGWLKKVVRVA